MSFLSPFLLLGLGALAVPVLVHLIQRERKRVVEFPSLMFVQKIPYQSVRRRRIRHWYLLLLRAAALALIVLAFARPFFPAGAAAAAAATGGSREVVILLDRSASMGYGDRWDRARAEASRVVASLNPEDRATLVLFGRNAEENIRATADRGRLQAAIDAATLTSGGTRFGPALKLAESILAASPLTRREAVLVSDFQKSGWSGSEDVHFGTDLTLTPVSVATEAVVNIAVPSVAFARSSFSNQERITVTAGIANKSAAPARGVEVSLAIDGHDLETKSVDVGPNASASVAFAPFTLTGASMHGVVRAGTDALPADNTFDFVLTPSRAVKVLVVDAGGASSFFLGKALGIGNTPTFEVDVVAAGRVTPQMLDSHAVVILNDAPLPASLAGGALRQFVERGGGLVVALGERATWPPGDTVLMPGTLGPVVDRTDGRGATIGFRDYSHAVFEVFKAPRSGDFSAARILRYRSLQAADDARVLARFDDGAAAAVERRVGEGRVVVLTTTLDDSWTDLALKPVYLPLVHQIVRYVAQYEQTSAWSTVGQVVDLNVVLRSQGDRVVVTPAGERIRFARGEPAIVELAEHGVYEIRTTEDSGRADRIAVNIDPAESDLASMDPGELVAAATGRASAAPAAAVEAPAELTPADAEKRQGFWWYLLLAGLALLVAEMVVANRLSRHERFT